MNNDINKEIYDEYKNGISLKELSAKYSLSISRIHQIIRNCERREETKLTEEKWKEFDNLKPCERCVNKNICKYVDVEIPKVEYPFTIKCQMQEDMLFRDWLDEVEGK